MARYEGDADDNTLAGRDEPDIIVGYGGSDTLYGGKGNDHLYNNGESAWSGANNDGVPDTLYGQDGNDFLYVASRDEAYGGAANDIFFVGPGTTNGYVSLLDGGGGTDTLILADGIDITGTPANQLVSLEILLAGNGVTNIGGASLTAAQLGTFRRIAPIAGTEVALTLTGGGTAVINPDGVTTLTIRGSTQGETLDASETATRLVYRGNSGQVVGDAEVRAGRANDHLEGSTGTDRLYGGGGDDELFNHFQNPWNDGARDFLYGQDGNDTLYVASLDVADGGDGNDTIVVGPGLPATQLDGGAGDDDTLELGDGTGVAFGATRTTLDGLEVLRAGDGSTGNAPRLTADQLGTFDSIEAFPGKTRVHLWLEGGGDAVLNPVDGIATLTVDGSSEDETLNLVASTATELLYYGRSGDATVRGGAGDDQLQGGAGMDSLYGRDGNDELFENGQSGGSDGVTDSLYGQDGNDMLQVGSGDRARGGDGNDTIIVVGGGPAPIVLDGDAGNDTLRVTSDISAATVSDVERLEAGDLLAPARLTAPQLDSFARIAGIDDSDSAAVALTAGGSASIGIAPSLAYLYIDGSSDDDQIMVRGSAGQLVSLNGGAGVDSLRGQDEEDILSGGSETDSLYGGDGNDTLFGEAGTDTLWGEAGSDSLQGGDGADIFATLPGGGTETVVDFEDGSDQLHFQAFGTAFDTAAEILARATQDGDDVRITVPNPDGGRTIMVLQDFQLANLSADDLIL